MKKLLLILLAVALLFSFASCGEKEHVDNDNDGKCDECGETLNENPPACTEHADENSDGKCDTCGTAVETEEPDVQDDPLVLIEDGVANFKIIYSSSFGGTMVKAVTNFVKNMKSEGITIVAEADDDNTETEIEVLVGTTAGRGEEYEIDIHTLGEKGYMVKRIGSKIIVLGGSDDALKDAFDAFTKDYIGYKKNKTPENLTVTSENDIIKPQTGYRITSVSVNGVDLKGYNIVIQGVTADNVFASDYTAVAEELQYFLYSKAGYWLPIEDEVGENSIVISATTDAGDGGFRILVRENALYIECAYNNAFRKSYDEFFTGISIKQGDIDFDADYSFTKEVNIVTYKEFGAKGNGEENDFNAIKAAHDYANAGGQKVIADKGTYLITKTGGKDKTITIMTDTDWTNAKFIIDDRNITSTDPEKSAYIFTIASSYKTETFTPDSPGKAGETIRAINEAAKNKGGIALAYGEHPVIDLGLGYAAMLSIHDDENRQYIRYGGNENNGYYQREIVVVDENGVGSSDTGILHDFSKITSIVVTRIDDTPVTIKGGEITTRANQGPAEYQYFNRGFLFKRANSVLDGLVHYITDEGDTGNPYHGFIRVQETYNVTIQNCKLSGHRVYDAQSSGGVTPQGSYDITAWDACNVTWKNIVQMNFFHLDKNGNSTGILSTVKNSQGWYCWGIMSSNYCKNLTYDNCILTRFDAHCGTYNATIKDSTVAVIAMIGGGKLEIINSTVYDTFTSVIVLRDDYGSTFAGDVIMKDVTFKVTQPTKTIQNATVNLIEATYTNHDFGYTTYLPQNIIIDNFVVEGPSPVENITILTMKLRPDGNFADAYLHPGLENKNPMMITKTITVKNNKSGYEYIHPKIGHTAFNQTELALRDED